MTEQSIEDSPAEITEPRDFSAFLFEINRGDSHRELSAALAELVAAVTRTGKPGSLTYTVRVEPQRGNEHIVCVTDQIGGKPPQGERRTSIFFVDDTNSLVRNDPRQQSIFDLPGEVQ